jgi:hypothetical protein
LMLGWLLELSDHWLVTASESGRIPFNTHLLLVLFQLFVLCWCVCE